LSYRVQKQTERQTNNGQNSTSTKISEVTTCIPYLIPCQRWRLLQQQKLHKAH